MVQVGGVEERAGLPGLLQGGQHDLVPQLPVKANDLLDVAEELGGLHLRQQAALLQVDQPAQEELRGEKPRRSKRVRPPLKPQPADSAARTHVGDDPQLLDVRGFGVQKLPYGLLLVELSPG